MSRRTRKTPFGLKTRLRKRPAEKHGPIRRIVGDTPTQTLAETRAERELDERIERLNRKKGRG